MLYNGHLLISETILRIQSNHDETLTKKPLYSGHFYSGHVLWTSREHIGQILPLKSEHPTIGWKNENTWMLLFDTFLYFNMKLNDRFFQAILHLCYDSYISLKIKFTGILSLNPTPRLALFPVTSTRIWWFANWRNQY